MMLPSHRLTLVLGIVAVCAFWATAGVSAEPLSVGALGTPLPEAEKQPQEVVDAIAYFRRLNFDKALELLREAAKEHPELPPARIMMAQLFAQANQAGATRSSLERGTVEDPADPEAFVILGDIALSEGRVTEAGLLFAKSLTLMQTFTGSAERKRILEPRVYGGLAAAAEAHATITAEDTARAKQHWATAEKHLQNWLQVDPKSAAAMQRLARALFKQDKAQDALNKLKEAKAADPKVLAPAVQMGQLYHQAGDYKNAKQWMDFALKTEKDDLRVHLIVAQWCLETSNHTEEGEDQLDKAKQLSARAMQIDPQSLQAMILRGVVALFQKDFVKAANYFESALLQSPRNFAAKNNLALALCEQDDPAEKRRALAYAEENVRLYPRNAEAASTYGWVLYRNARAADADRVLSRLVRGGRVSEDTAYYAARVAAESGRPEEAIQLLERALESKRPFSKRKEAEALLEQLRRRGG